MKKKTTKYLCFLVIFGVLVNAPFFVTDVSAALCPYNYLGAVTRIDTETNTIEIQTDLESIGGGSWMSNIRKIQGKAPRNVAKEIQINDYIEAASLGSPGDTWVALARMKSPAENVITDIYGDPIHLLSSSLLGGFEITYENVPDCSTWLGGCSCEAEYTIITINRDGHQLDKKNLYPGQTYTYEEGEFRLKIAFYSGEASANPKCTKQLCRGPQPISDFTIHSRLKDEEVDQDNDGYTTSEGDCDDTNSQIHPGAEEPCGEDYNCDGYVTPCEEIDDAFCYKNDKISWGSAMGRNYGFRVDVEYPCAIDTNEKGKIIVDITTRDQGKAGDPDSENNIQWAAISIATDESFYLFPSEEYQFVDPVKRILYPIPQPGKALNQYHSFKKDILNFDNEGKDKIISIFNTLVGETPFLGGFLSGAELGVDLFIEKDLGFTDGGPPSNVFFNNNDYDKWQFFYPFEGTEYYGANGIRLKIPFTFEREGKHKIYVFIEGYGDLISIGGIKHCRFGKEYSFEISVGGNEIVEKSQPCLGTDLLLIFIVLGCIYRCLQEKGN